MIDITTLPVNKQFTRRMIRPDSWIINCYDPNQAAPHPHVLIGDKYALVIDPTWTKLPLRKYVEEYVTDKPILIACTHSHHDHTNANWMFNDLPIYMSEFAWKEIQHRRTLSDEEGKWMGHPHGDYVPHLLKVGDTLDLGNRIIECIPYKGCHSEGSLMFLDHKYGLLFTGDELECGQILVAGHKGVKSSVCVEKLRDNVKILVEEYEDKIDLVCPPHNGSPVDKHFLRYILENCERIMAGCEGDPDVGSMTYLYNPLEDRSEKQIREVLSDPLTRRSEWKGTSIVYSTERIFRSQVEE